MEIRIVEEAGHTAAVTGMKFSHQTECDLMEIEEAKYADTKTTRALAKQDSGHNKFLESIIVWVDIRAKLKFWKQFDTYRIGVTKQSKSTMHSIMKRPLTRDDFGYDIADRRVAHYNTLIAEGKFEEISDDLSEGYLQTRRVCLSYKVIRHIIMQRRNHKLPEWQEFCEFMKDMLKYPRLLGGV